MNDVSPPTENEKPPKRTLKERMLHNFREVFSMFLYLWLLFGLFTLHEAVVLARQGIDFQPFGLAFINAFVLAKVMLVAEELNIGTRLRGRAPIFPILHKSLLFALIFVGFSLTEKLLIGWWKGKTIAESLPRFGGGSPVAILVVALIAAVALIPFFAFRELSRVMGKGVLGALFLRGSALPSRGVSSESKPS